MKQAGSITKRAYDIDLMTELTYRFVIEELSSPCTRRYGEYDLVNGACCLKI